MVCTAIDNSVLSMSGVVTFAIDNSNRQLFKQACSESRNVLCFVAGFNNNHLSLWNVALSVGLLFETVPGYTLGWLCLSLYRSVLRRFPLYNREELSLVFCFADNLDARFQVCGLFWHKPTANSGVDNVISCCFNPHLIGCR